MKKILLLAAFLFALLLSACAQSTATEENLPTVPPPAAGMTSVTGRVIHKNTNDPFPNTIVRLAEVVRSDTGDDVYVLDHAFSPGVKTNEKGIFLFENVDPIEYVIVVGNVENLYEIIPKEDGKPRVWVTYADEVLDVGDLKVLLEPTQP